jgi:hypothetical protein
VGREHRYEGGLEWPPLVLRPRHPSWTPFGERLMPVLKDVGIELSGEPEMLEIHNLIKR